MKKTNKIIAFILSAALIFAFAGCGTNTRYIATVNGEGIAAGVYIINQYYAAREAQGKFFEAYPEEDYPDIDFWAVGFNHDEYQIEGVKYSEWVNNRALELTAKTYAIEEMFKARGLSFTAEELAEYNTEITKRWNEDMDKDQIDEFYEMYGDMAYDFAMQLGLGGLTWAQFFEEKGVGKESFAFLTMGDRRAAAIFESIYGPDGTNPVPDNVWKSIFEEEYVRFNLLEVKLVDDDGEEFEKERTEKLKIFVQEQLELIENGGTFAASQQAFYFFNTGMGGDNIFDLDIDDLYWDDEDEEYGDEEENDADSDEDESSDEDENETDSEESNEDDEESDEDSGTESASGLTEEEEDFNEAMLRGVDVQNEIIIKIADIQNEDIAAFLKELDFDTPAVFESETAHYIFMKYNVLEREEIFDEYREAITFDLKINEFDDMLNNKGKELLESDAFVVNQKAFERYSPRKFMSPRR